MKRIICFLIIFALLFTGCSKSNTITSKEQHIEKLAVSNEFESIQINSVDYDNFISYLNYDNIECPYGELFDIESALNEKQSYVFDVKEHTYDFFEGASVVDAEKLYNVVKKNNEKYMEGVGKHFNKELSNSKLRECCEIVADTLNWGIDNIKGIDLGELGCILGNLKIVNTNSMNLGTFSDKNDSLKISPDMIKQKKNRNGNSNMYELTVSHEAMHILQCRCTDVEQKEEDSFIGTSYSFETLDINPLKHSWLYEASAERNAVLKLGSNPTTYQYMIDNLETISLSTVLNKNVQARQLEKLCFTQDNNTLYKQLEFSDEKKAIEFLYVVELLRNRPEDFKLKYENEYGELPGDYSEFLKLTYNPYFVEVTSKLFYKNLALSLLQNSIELSDVYYLIFLYEVDLLKDIPFDSSSVREKYNETYVMYVNMQREFFNMLQKYVSINVEEEFTKYQMNYEGSEMCANARLDWLDNEKREYLLYRNEVLFDSQHKCILSYQ